MKSIYIFFLFFVFVSCSTNKVVSKGFLSKRKYTTGFNLSIRNSIKNSSEEKTPTNHKENIIKKQLNKDLKVLNPEDKKLKTHKKDTTKVKEIHPNRLQGSIERVLLRKEENANSIPILKNKHLSEKLIPEQKEDNHSNEALIILGFIIASIIISYLIIINKTKSNQGMYISLGPIGLYIALFFFSIVILFIVIFELSRKSKKGS